MICQSHMEMLFPPWTVTRQVYTESLTAQHSGISNDILLFSEVGLSLVHHYRVHRKGLPHAAFRGVFAAARSPTVEHGPVDSGGGGGGASSAACSPVPSTADNTDVLGAMF